MYNYTIDGNVNNMVYTARSRIFFFFFFFYYTYLQGFPPPPSFFLFLFFFILFFSPSPFLFHSSSKIHRTQESRVKTYLRDTMKGKKKEDGKTSVT